MDPQSPAPLPPVPTSGQTPPQYPQPYGPTDDPYRFIMEPPKKPKAAGRGIGGNPFIIKLLFIIGAAMVLMFAAGIAVNFFFSKKTNIQDIVTITQVEQELVRVGSQGTNAADQSIKNASVTTSATLTTQQQQWITFLAQRNRKVPPKELVLKKSAATDQRLNQAQQTSTFDLVFAQIMRAQLQSYAALLKTASNNASNKDEKILLAQQYDDVQLLLEQWPEKSTQ